MTQVVNRRHTKHWDVNVMRPGPWGNPVIVGRRCPVCGHKHTGRDSQALLCFGKLLRQALDGSEFRARLQALEGKVLACCCVPDRLCHGEVLRAYLDGFSERLAIMAGAEKGSQEQLDIAHASGMLSLEQDLEWMRQRYPPAQTTIDARPDDD